MRVSAIVLLGLLGACTPEPAKVAQVQPTADLRGCAKDNDCKGERICVDSACQDPAPPEPPEAEKSVEGVAPSPAPSLAPPPPPVTRRPPKPPAPKATFSDKAPVCIPVASTSPRRGPEAALVTVLVFADVQCPFSAKVMPILEQVQLGYNEQVALHFRHLPLPFHKSAEIGARAIQAAGRQKKAWELGDAMFVHAQKLDEPFIHALAKSLGLNAAKFKRDFESKVVAQEIADDVTLTSRLAYKATPTILINGKQFTGERTVAEFKGVFEKEIVRAEAAIAAGTAKKKVYETLCQTP
jgi:protein-disulfide isomerase